MMFGESSFDAKTQLKLNESWELVSSEIES